jgi:inward rectifier potassium channel
VNRDGSFNTRKEGVPFRMRFSIYHSMLNLPRWKFIGIIIVFYFSINLFYSGLYLIAGTDQLVGILGKTGWARFKEVYFFSTETFTTVGYGRINPIGDWANIISSIEAMTGFLSFAIATGLIYGRFSKPRAYLVFSDYALVAPYQDKTALMFRFASYKENHMLTNVEVLVTTGFQVMENDKPVFKFYSLSLERNRVDSLPMNFTVVHPIDENSPLAGMGFEDMKTADLEVYVLIRGFDDVYSNNVLQRTSYVYDEILFNRKFLPMYRESNDGNTTILELQKINESVEVLSPPA